MSPADRRLGHRTLDQRARRGGRCRGPGERPLRGGGARPARGHREPWRRLHRWAESGLLTGDLLPILATASVLTAYTREWDTLRSLAAVLSARPDLRSRLAEPARMTRLASDLTTGLFAAPVERTGARRDTTDIVVALRQAGFSHHPFGRPLGAQPMPSLAEIIRATRTRLDAIRLPARPSRRRRHDRQRCPQRLPRRQAVAFRCPDLNVKRGTTRVPIGIVG
jgi:hypothetical protein